MLTSHDAYVADLIPKPSTARHAFLNAIRILHSMEPSWLPRDHYDRFIDSPTEYLMRADEPTLARIWGEVQARQPVRYRS